MRKKTYPFLFKETRRNLVKLFIMIFIINSISNLNFFETHSEHDVQNFEFQSNNFPNGIWLPGEGDE